MVGCVWSAGGPAMLLLCSYSADDLGRVGDVEPELPAAIILRAADTDPAAWFRPFPHRWSYQPGEATPLPAQPLDPAAEAESLARLHETIVPIADPLDLAKRLRGIADPPRVIADSGGPDSPGHDPHLLGLRRRHGRAVPGRS